METPNGVMLMRLSSENKRFTFSLIASCYITVTLGAFAVALILLKIEPW